MPFPLQGKRAVLLSIIGLLCTTLVGVGWFQAGALQGWYRWNQLQSAAEADEPEARTRLASLGLDAWPAIRGGLRTGDTATAKKAELTVRQMLTDWGAGDPRSATMLENLATELPNCREEGQLAALAVAEPCLAQVAEPVDGVDTSLGKVLVAAANSPGRQPRARAVALAQMSLAWRNRPALERASALVFRATMRDPESDVRVQSLRLAMRLGQEYLKEAVASLSDSSREVRRAAMLALASSPDALATDDLLHWLHDPDFEVRHLCEQALRARGLQDLHLKLGRLMTDARPSQRLLVLDQLRGASDLDAGVWLRRLSHDPSPAIRAAALRAAAEDVGIDMADRLEQVSQNDPSPTVRQLAGYYLSKRKNKAPRDR